MTETHHHHAATIATPTPFFSSSSSSTPLHDCPEPSLNSPVENNSSNESNASTMTDPAASGGPLEEEEITVPPLGEPPSDEDLYRSASHLEETSEGLFRSMMSRPEAVGDANNHTTTTTSEEKTPKLSNSVKRLSSPEGIAAHLAAQLPLAPTLMTGSVVVTSTSGIGLEESPPLDPSSQVPRQDTIPHDDEVDEIMKIITSTDPPGQILALMKEETERDGDQPHVVVRVENEPDQLLGQLQAPATESSLDHDQKNITEGQQVPPPETESPLPEMTAAAAPASSKSYSFLGWFTGGSSTSSAASTPQVRSSQEPQAPAPTADPEEAPPLGILEENEGPPPSVAAITTTTETTSSPALPEPRGDEDEAVAPGSKLELDSALTDSTHSNVTEPQGGENKADNTPLQEEGVEKTSEEDHEHNNMSSPHKKEMDEVDRRALEEAFHDPEPSSSLAALEVVPEDAALPDTPVVSPLAQAPLRDPEQAPQGRPVVAKAPAIRPRGLGEIHPDTPIPHADVALRLLRKFAQKTRPKIVSTYGGSKSRTLFGYLFGVKEDPTFVPYRELMEILFQDGEDPDWKDDSERVVEAVLGESGDSAERARLAVAAFVYVFSVWGHASSRYFEKKDSKGQKAFSELLTASLDAASSLVAHGCLDGVLLGVAGDRHMEFHRLVHMLAQSVFNSDLSIEKNELQAMKFLLVTGCRVNNEGDALLHGSHLLQTIRTLYHVYLTTESGPNKTTARAALQQLVTSVFARAVQTRVSETERTVENFPSENHRDAYLVLRSICRLSMRNLPSPDSGMHSHIGLHSSGSSDTWDGDKGPAARSPLMERAEGAALDGEAPPREHAQLLYTSAIHPALESKLLALELILYVLQNTDFSREFIHRSGAQFHAAVRNYLCVSLLKNCTSDNTQVVILSLRIFAPLVRNFRTILKNEIEAFVTNVFFVILDSKNSPAEHKSLVVKTFDEICSDPQTLAEIFLNYDCDLSAVDLFHRIVNTLSKVSRTELNEHKSSGLSFMGGASAARLEKTRSQNRELRLDAMRALRQTLASLYGSILKRVSSMEERSVVEESVQREIVASGSFDSENGGAEEGKQNLVEIYGSKKKRRAEEAEIILRFNQKPSAGIAYAAKCMHIDGESPADVAGYLLKNKDLLEKTQIGEYLGREPDYQNGFSLKVLHEYVRLMDFAGLMFDDAIRYFLSTFRLPGEAQKIDRIMEKFAERFTEQNPDVFPTADVAFILSFSIIMLNTDLHNPAIKEERRMTKEGFIRNNRGIADGKDLPEELLNAIFDRIKQNPISLKEDDEARERANASDAGGLPSALSPVAFFSNQYYFEIDRARESNFQKERDHIVRTTESLLKRRRYSHDFGKHIAKSRAEKPLKQTPRFVRTEESGLRDEYVSPMFEVTWAPALAAFSVAMESANGTVGALIAIASDEELEQAAENAAETIEVCLTGFKFAICTAGLCGNDTARDAYMLALSRFSQLGTGSLLEPRHVRCAQTLLSLAREHGELLGSSWQYVFRALSEINRFHQLFHLIARNDRVAAAAAERRKRKLEEQERRRNAREERRVASEEGETLEVEDIEDYDASEEMDSLAESDLFDDDVDIPFEEDMDSKAIDEANARFVYDAISEAWVESIYERSSSLSAPAVKEFVIHLCAVSQAEISKGGSMNGSSRDQFHHSQPSIFNLQKLVEVTHYNMDSRPRMVFADLWAIVANHLTNTALHSNPAIAMYAVDSFRQLSIQYLQRDELEVFEFQRRFLKPLETVMSRSAQDSTKELLLDCVDRVIHVFRVDKQGPEARQRGGLRSGWVPILVILGLGGRDVNKTIAQLSLKILANEINLCVQDVAASDRVLLTEHFVETVNSLFMFIGGPHDDVALSAMDQLHLLSEFLGSNPSSLPQFKRRSSHHAVLENPDEMDLKPELELWWPILLGLSRTVGDVRISMRTKAMDVLFRIISDHFFAPTKQPSAEEEKDELQTLQIVFRGVLTPILEFAEVDPNEVSTLSLPADFDRFLSAPKIPGNASPRTSWIDLAFEPFMDGCVDLCLKAIKAFDQTVLIDEIFAILNSCLLSDSGALAVRGLNRLERFITSDLDPSALTDDLWATVSHMLRRCLALRALPIQPRRVSPETLEDQERYVEEMEEYEAAVAEFLLEEKVLADRRYVGGNAVLTIGNLLSAGRFVVGFRWRLFLIAGVARAIFEWEEASSLLEARKISMKDVNPMPPDYRENAMYARKWMNRFLLQLVSMKEVAQADTEEDPRVNRFVAAQKLVIEEIQRLLSKFLEKERATTQYRPSDVDIALAGRFVALVSELLAGFDKMNKDHLQDLEWINPVLLTFCSQSKNDQIRCVVQKLVQQTSPMGTDQTPYPVQSPVNTEHDSQSEPIMKEAQIQSDSTDIRPDVTKDDLDDGPNEKDSAVSSASTAKGNATERAVDYAVSASSATRTNPAEPNADGPTVSRPDTWNPFSWFTGSPTPSTTTSVSTSVKDALPEAPIEQNDVAEQKDEPVVDTKRAADV